MPIIDSKYLFYARVHLEKVTSTSIVPQAVIEQKIGGTSGGTEMREIRRQQELMSQKEEESFTFQWQQKIYSQVGEHFS